MERLASIIANSLFPKCQIGTLRLKFGTLEKISFNHCMLSIPRHQEREMFPAAKKFLKIFSKMKSPSDFIPKGNSQSKCSIAILGKKIKQFLFHFFYAFRYRAVSFITQAFSNLFQCATLLSHEIDRSVRVIQRIEKLSFPDII